MAFGRNYWGYPKTERWTARCNWKDPDTGERCEAEFQVSISGGFPWGQVEDIPERCPEGHPLHDATVATRVWEDLAEFHNPSNYGP